MKTIRLASCNKVTVIPLVKLKMMRLRMTSFVLMIVHERTRAVPAGMSDLRIPLLERLNLRRKTIVSTISDITENPE